MNVKQLIPLQNPSTRHIRSYVCRQGYMTASQRLVLEHYWSTYGLTIAMGRFNMPCESKPLILEIGFGNGANLLEMARQHPEEHFIGIEVHGPGVGSLLRGLVADGLKNVNIYREDAIEVLTHCIAEGSVSCVQVFFPDPWHKRRHHKRRLVNPAFVELMHRVLRVGGHVHLATDWEDYAIQIMEHFSSDLRFYNPAGQGSYANSEQRYHRRVTAFEQRGLGLGHRICNMVFIKT